MTDLAKRLRDYVVVGHNPDGPPSIKFHPKIADDAADEIERKDEVIAHLRLEAEMLRAALKPFAAHAHATEHISQQNLRLWCQEARFACAKERL